MLAVYQMLGFVDARHHLLVFFRKPLADGHTRIIVVGTDEDQDGVEVVTMFLFQLVRLALDIIPLATTHPINIWFYLEPVLQESPVFLLRPAVSWVCDRVTKISHTFSLPGVLYHLLCTCRHREQRHKKNNK